MLRNPYDYSNIIDLDTNIGKKEIGEEYPYETVVYVLIHHTNMPVNRKVKLIGNKYPCILSHHTNMSVN